MQRHGSHKRFADGSERVLMRHAWPGNVRELRSTIQRSFLSSDGPCGAGPHLAAPHAHSFLADPDAVAFKVGMTYADDRARDAGSDARPTSATTAPRTARALGVSVRTIQNQLARLRGDGDDRPA